MIEFSRKVLIACIASCLCLTTRLPCFCDNQPTIKHPASIGTADIPANFLVADSVKKIFDDKKKSIARVVCVSSEESKNDEDGALGRVLAGSGFFVSDRAYVLTAASIVKNAQKIWVDYMGVSYMSECVGVDEPTNVAVLKLLQAPPNFVAIDIHCGSKSDLTEIGNFVVFVGCKMGMDPMPDIGLISGKNISYSENQFLTTYLRTNICFSGGESGAPVFELNGDISGMMVASLPEIRSSFVLPRRALEKVFDAIVRDGGVKHAGLGVEVMPECRFNAEQEMVISKVITGSSAEEAGVKVGDILKKIDGKKITYKEDVVNSLFFHDVKVPIDVEIARNDEVLTLSIPPEKVSVDK